MHRGDALPFWQQACAEGRPQACERLLRIEASYCADNAGWACNELGRHYVEGRLVAADAERALGYFARACEGRFQAGLREPARRRDAGDAPIRAPLDLRLLLREGGPNLLDMPEPELYARACRHGWSFACGKDGRRTVTRRARRSRLSCRPRRSSLALGALAAAAARAQPAADPGLPADRAARLRRDARRAVRRWAPAGRPPAFDNERWSAAAADGTVDGRRRSSSPVTK